MDPKHWQQIKSIFEQALEYDTPEKQRNAAKQLAKGDKQLYQQVVEMLDINASDETTAKAIPVEALNYINYQFEFKPGEILGNYKIIEKIAEGGMGAVYSAERSDQLYTQKVAIKAMKPQILNNKTLERFNTERQILANFNHPNIAQILDAGTTRDSIPYFVMEYIDGSPLIDYAKQHQLNLKQKLELFQQVCRAVEYAHKHLVIHRDIKANNVLISNNGDIKLLDFGIAKIMDIDKPDANATIAEQQVLTPENASPEQILGEPVTTATDIYMLGGLLYQLLTFNKPFCFKSQSFIEVERAVCHTAPLKPSANLSQKLSSESKHRLEKQLKGDLDNIILKAMEKDPSHRYSSVEALREDINRYTNYQPVKAKPETWLNLALKFIRRNRFLVGFSSLFLVTIIGLLTFVSLQAYQLKAERNRALFAEKQATQKSQVAAQASSFMVDIFNTADPRGAGNQFTSARDLLDSALAKLNKDRVNDDMVRLELLKQIGLAYRNLGQRKIANQVLEDSLILSNQLHGEVSLESADIMVHLGDSYRNIGQNEKALKLLTQALEIQIKLRPANSLEVAETHNNLAWVMYELGRIEDAIQYQLQSVKQYQANLDKNDSRLSTPYANISILYRRAGQYSKAIEYTEKALRIARSNNIPSNIANSLLNLGRLNRSVGNYQQALANFEECKAIRIELFGDSNNGIAMLDRDIAITLQKLGEIEKSKQLFLAVEAQLLTRIDDSRISYAIWQYYWGLFLKQQGELIEAEKQLQQSVDTQIERFGARYERVARYRRDLAELYLLNGKTDLAERMLADALEYLQANNPSNHLQIGLVHYSLIKLYSLKNDLVKRDESIQLAQQHFSKIDPRAEQQQMLAMRIERLSTP